MPKTFLAEQIRTYTETTTYIGELNHIIRQIEDTYESGLCDYDEMHDTISDTLFKGAIPAINKTIEQLKTIRQYAWENSDNPDY